MKLTPLGKVIVVLALLVAAFFAVRRFAPNLKTWATGKKGDAAASAKNETVSKDDFNALGSAPPDPERGKGSEGVTPAANLGGGGKLDRPLVVAINTWAGHSPGIVFNNGMDPNSGLELQEEVRDGREVRPPRGPGGQARGLPQGRRRHHVGHGRQLGARGVDPRRAEPEGQVDHHAGLVARRRRHRLAGLDQLDRGAQGAQDRLHAVHPLALPAALPALAVGPLAGGPRGGREEHHLHPGRPGRRRRLQGQAGRRRRDLGARSLGRGDGARRRGARPGLDHRGDQHHRRHPGGPAGADRQGARTPCATSSTAGSRASR